MGINEPLELTANFTSQQTSTNSLTWTDETETGKLTKAFASERKRKQMGLVNSSNINKSI